MKCDEVQALHGPYLDSELDARTSLEIEQHLKACPACAHLFADEEKLEARIKAGLKQGVRTPALWEQIERGVIGDLTQRRKGTQRGGAATTAWAPNKPQRREVRRGSVPFFFSALFASLRFSRRVAILRGLRTTWTIAAQSNAAEMSPPRLSAPLCVSALARLRAGWQRSRWAWGGLAAVWAVILALNGAAREPGGQIVTGKQLPPAAEVRFAVEQKHLLMADLAFTTEPTPADKPKAAPPSPRSDRRKAALNT